LADHGGDIDGGSSSFHRKPAQLGVSLSSYNLTPKQMLEEFYRRDPTGNEDRIYAEIVQNAPILKLAETNVVQTQSDLDQAELNFELLHGLRGD
jgi:hypothetical protein